MDLKIEEEREQNILLIDNQKQFSSRTSFLRRSFEHMRLLIISLIFRGPMTRHKTTMYNAYDSVCRIISTTSSTCEGASGVILYVCVGEEEREREIR